MEKTCQISGHRQSNINMAGPGWLENKTSQFDDLSILQILQRISQPCFIAEEFLVSESFKTFGQSQATSPYT